MSKTGTHTRAALRPNHNLHRSQRVIDITDEATRARGLSGQKASTTHSRGIADRHPSPASQTGTQRDPLRVDRFGPDSDSLAVTRALLFAHGLDERGRRLALASDSMSDEERRPHHIVAQRQGAPRIPIEFADVYRRAEQFDDELPNVRNVVPLTHKVRIATTDRSALSESGAPRFDPRPSPGGLRLVAGERLTRPVRTAPSPERLAPSARFAPVTTAARTHSVRPSTTAAGSSPAAPSAAKPSHAPSPLNVGRVGRSTDGHDGLSAVGALALARAVPAQARRSNTAPTKLHAVSSPRRTHSFGVATFWVVFLLAFLFVAVVMHAGIANRQMTLDEINVELEQAEFTNAQLRVEVASLQSPTRIAEAASRLGLSNPKGIRFVQAVPASVVSTPAVTPAVTDAAPGHAEGSDAQSGIADPSRLGAESLTPPVGR
jgi:cell division protein FtsL